MAQSWEPTKFKVWVRFKDSRKEVYDIGGCQDMTHKEIVLFVQSIIGREVQSLLYVVV